MRQITSKSVIGLVVGVVGLVTFSIVTKSPLSWLREIRIIRKYFDEVSKSPYGRFPRENDPFKLVPCTERSLPPSLDDPRPSESWAARFDPNPGHWSWGSRRWGDGGDDDPFSGRGIYLCGYLDLPLDYRNESDQRIVRLAVSKYQVSGLARVGSHDNFSRGAGNKSPRTIVLEPGGPGGSGTLFVWDNAETVTERFSNGRFDVLGWDPRGVNASLPAISCVAHDALRDRWSLPTNKYREDSKPMDQLRTLDALNSAMFKACWERFGDLGRFVSTGMVARDLEEIRKALSEDDLTAYMLSYGTGIGQTYANMFPGSVGRMILDGTEYVKDHRLLGGFGWTALDNTTDAWNNGFLGECVQAGPDRCALAKLQAKNGERVTIEQLKLRMARLIQSLIHQPIPAYIDSAGPSIITYSGLVDVLYTKMYDPATWPETARMLYELELGNSTQAATLLDTAWRFNPASHSKSSLLATDELFNLVVCSDAYDDPEPESGLVWWDTLWANMTSQSWIAGNSRFFTGLPCRHYKTYWPNPVGVYRGNLNHVLKSPVLLIAEPHDPATPLRNGRRLLADMGSSARLIVHHGYGHTSRHDRSSCTDRIGSAYILDGKLPGIRETDCYADKKPYDAAGESVAIPVSSEDEL